MKNFYFLFSLCLLLGVSGVKAQEMANSLHFDGNDYVAIPHDAAFNFSNAVTVEAWIKVDAFDKEWQFLVTHGDHTWRLHRQGATNFLAFTLNGVGSVVSDVNVNNTEWHHVAGTYDGSAIKIYIDGALNNTQSASGNMSMSNHAVWLGSNVEVTDRQFKGSMDEVRIWGVARSAEDITDFKDCELSGDEDGLVAYYQFNQGESGGSNSAVTTLTDATGNGHDGTLNGFALTGTSSNWLTGSPVTLGETCPEKVTWYADVDDDGYATTRGAFTSPGDEWYATLAETGATTIGDCDDNDGNVHPGATEILDNGIDDDCDANTLGISSSEGPEDVCQPYATYPDNDGDMQVQMYYDDEGSWARLNRSNALAKLPFGNQDGQEGVIEDYIMYVDGEAIKLTYRGWTIGYWQYYVSVNIWDYEGGDNVTWENPEFYPDFDGDGVICDCDDTDAGVGAAPVWYTDADGDGYAAALWACSQPVGFVADLGIWTLGDCNDDPGNGGAAVHPGATEITGNGIDDDCDPTTSDFAGRPFIVTAKTFYHGALDADNVIMIGIDPENLTGYDFEVDWGDGSGDRYDAERLEATFQQVMEEGEGWPFPYHMYAQPGAYTVKIYGILPAASVVSVVSIEQWGDIEWKSMNGMFSGADDLAGYHATDAPDLSDVTDMSSMFYGASKFNVDISAWDVSHVTDMSYMFYDASSFNQNLGSWDISAIVDDPEATDGMDYMLSNTALSIANYETTLAGWATLDEGETAIPTGVYLGADGLKYCDATYRDLLTTATDVTPTPGYGWEIDDDGPLGDGVIIDVEELPGIVSLTGEVTSLTPPTATSCTGTITATTDAVLPITSSQTVMWTYDDGNAETEDPTQEQEVLVYTGAPFVTTWQTYDDGGHYIDIFSGLYEYRYVVDWGDPDQPGIDYTVYTGHTNHEYSQPGVYTVKIYGQFPSLDTPEGYGELLRSIEQWGDIEWKNMSYSFALASNMVYNATDVPDLSAVTSMYGLFLNASLNANLGNWDISNITTMEDMLSGTAMSRQNYEATLAGWSTLDEGETKIPTGISLGASGLKYCESDARTLLSTATDATAAPGYGWTITGDAQDCSLVLSITNQAADEDTELSFTASATYTGDGTLAYSLDENSEDKGMALNEQTGSFSWTPTQAQTGNHSVTITVNDDGSSEDSYTFTITVNPVNDAPVLSANMSPMVSQGDAETITNAMLLATDEDNTPEEIVFTVTALPANGSLFKNEIALTLNDTFTQADINENSVSYRHDGFGSTADKFTFTVSDGLDGSIAPTDFEIAVDIVLSAETRWNGGVRLYPIPASKEVTIKIVNAYLGTVVLRIVDLSGREVIMKNVRKENLELIDTINISNVATGISFIRVAMGGQLYTLKLLKQ